MPWIKVSDDPPDFRDWLKCDSCGRLALKTQNHIYASEVGEPCEYCSTPLRLATVEDMKAAYPDGVYDWKDETRALTQ